MKSDSFRFSRKATAVLLLCTGLVASHPIALWAEDGVTTVQAVQQQQVIVKGTVSDAMDPSSVPMLLKKETEEMEPLPILMETSRSK